MSVRYPLPISMCTAEGGNTASANTSTTVQKKIKLLQLQDYIKYIAWGLFNYLSRKIFHEISM